MAKQKENAVVASQEQLADGIYSMWIQTQAADTAKPGQFISVYDRWKQVTATPDQHL